MPYIKQKDRPALTPTGHVAKTPGELNFQISMLIKAYLLCNAPSLNYQQLNDVLGAVEGAKLEFYRQVVVPYEEHKIETNGGVY